MTPLRSFASFTSGRINFFPAVDRRTLQSYIDDLFDWADTHLDVLDDYSTIKDQLRAQELCGDRLERQLNDVRYFDEPIRQFLNQRYNNLRDTLGDAEQNIAEFQEELIDQEGRLKEIPILKSAILKLNATRHADQEKHRRQMASLKK